MEDIHSYPDERRVPINHAGVSDLRYPIIVFDHNRVPQKTVASLSMSVSLPHHFKGAHMSRFIEILNEHHSELTTQTIHDIVHNLRRRLDAEGARVSVTFPLFFERTAPVSGSRALMDYECALVGEAHGRNERFVLSVRVPVTSLCPCSKAISDYGAHNQRGFLTIEVTGDRDAEGRPLPIWFDELIEVAESSGSAPVYALLKRVDERHVTMQAYDNPVFVEDMVRGVAIKLQADTRITWFRVHAVNHESIHNHNAYAEVEWSRGA